MAAVKDNKGHLNAHGSLSVSLLSNLKEKPKTAKSRKESVEEDDDIFIQESAFATNDNQDLSREWKIIKQFETRSVMY